MTKTVRVFETGPPEVLRIEDVPVPSPSRGEVLIRQQAIGVNFVDTYYRSGAYPVASLPFTPGNEAAGEIIGLGAGVTDFKLGDRVAYYFSQLGGYAGERVVPADRVLKLPKSLSYQDAAAVLLKGLTAQYLLRQTFKIKPDHVILIHAAAGGTGLILTQWAKALGATVIGTVGSPEKAKLAKKAGAKHTILYRDEDFVAKVKDITKGKLVDVVYDGVGKATFPASLDCLRPLGMFVSFGSASGQIDAFNINLLQTKGSLFATRPTLNHYAAKREDLLKLAAETFEVIASGKVKIPVNQRYPLKDAQQAHHDLESRATTGASILLP